MNTKLIDILLAEDNDDDIVLIQEAFAEAKIANLLQVVNDGQEAMAYLRREGKYQETQMPGLLLLDINMPRKNGFEVLKEMKADTTLRHIPVVMLTTSNRDEDIIKSYEEGACTYIRKPVDFDQLKDVVKQFALYWGLVATLPKNKA
jgi:CheY-like chemotaxis protein